MNRRVFLGLLPIPFIVRPKAEKLFKWDMHPAQKKFFENYNHIETIYIPYMRNWRF